MQKNNVLLIRGSGAIGSYTAKELAALGYDVDIISLDKLADTQRIHYIRAFADYNMLSDILDGQYYSAIVDFSNPSPDECSRLLELFAAHTDQFIYLSSYRVYDDRMHPIREDAPQLADRLSKENMLSTMQAYPWTKSMCEHVIRTSIYAQKVTIVRPVISFYHGRLSFITLKAPNIVLRSGLKPLLVPQEAQKILAGFSFSGNVGKEIAHLIGKEKAFGEAFNVGTDEGLTWGDIAPIFTQTLGSEFVWVDSDTFLRYTTPDDVGEYYGLHHDRLIDRDVDVSKVLSVTGLTRGDLLPTLEAVAKEAEIIKQDRERYIQGVNWSIEKNQDRYFQSIR